MITPAGGQGTDRSIAIARKRVDPLQDPADRPLQHIAQLTRDVSGGAPDPAKVVFEVPSLAARELGHDAGAAGTFGERDRPAARMCPAHNTVVVQKRTIEQHPGKVRLRVGPDAKAVPTFPVSPRRQQPTGNSPRPDLAYLRESAAE